MILSEDEAEQAALSFISKSEWRAGRLIEIRRVIIDAAKAERIMKSTGATLKESDVWIMEYEIVGYQGKDHYSTLPMIVSVNAVSGHAVFVSQL